MRDKKERRERWLHRYVDEAIEIEMEMQVRIEIKIERYILRTLPVLAKQTVDKRKRYYCSLLFDTDKHDIMLWPLSSWFLNLFVKQKP